MPQTQSKTIFHNILSDIIPLENAISKQKADQLFLFFKDSKLFKWTKTPNDCEDRANAICILLDAWKITNYKGWIFSGYFLKKDLSSLKNRWNYHVAPLLPVAENGIVNLYILDPTTQHKLELLADWAESVTEDAYSYHLIKFADYYIFDSKKVEAGNWHKRNRRNYRWTMQGLSGINGLSATGKAQLRFCKQKVINTQNEFREMSLQNPFGY